MTLTAQLLKKDWQARRTAILVWIGLLALCLLVQLNPIDRGSNPERDAGFVLVLVLLPLACLQLLLGITGNTVGEDSPVRRERFLATRPMPATKLWLSKALFLGLVVLLPVALLSAVSLAVASHDPRVVVLGTLQMTLLATAVTSFAAGFVSLWSSRKETMIGIVAIGGVFIVFGLAGISFLPTNWFDDLVTRRPLETTLGLLVSGGLLCLLAGRRRLVRSRLPLRLAVLGLCTLVGLLLAAFLPSPRTTAAAAPTPAEDLQPQEAGHRLHWSDGQKQGPLLNVQLTLDRPATLQPGQDIEWFWRGVRVNGRAQENPYLRRRSLGAGDSDRDRYRDSLRTRLEGMLGHPSTWVLLEDPHGSLDRPATVNVVFPGVAPDSSESFELGVDLGAWVYEWDCLAELPLAPGARTSADRSSWSVSTASRPDESNYDPSVVLSHSSPVLWFSADAAERPQPIYGRYRADAFLLHDPVRERVFLGLEASPQSRGYLPTGYKENRIDLRVPRGQDTLALLNESWPDLRLLVFRPRVVERIERRWTTRPVIPRHIPVPKAPNESRRPDLGVGQFARKYQALDKPAGGARDIGRFLDAVIVLAARCDGSVSDAREPWSRDLASLVPRHLDTFLDRFRRLDANDHRARRLLLSAMEYGCLDEQADVVADALPQDPGLLPLVLFRGWSGRARPALLEQFDYGLRSYDLLEALDRLGAFEDPARKAALLGDLRRDPDNATYQILRRLEGAGDELDAVVAKSVEAYPRILPGGLIESRRHFDLPLTHGRIEAVVELQRVAVSLGESNRSERYRVQELLDLHFDPRGIADSQRHDGESLLKWFLERDPEKFRFDPISRRFVWPNPNP